MLRPTKDLLNLAIEATDGTVGDVTDLYFDDETWTVRYLIVETGSWLSSRKVLISPIAAGKPDWKTKKLPVSLARDQVENSPSIDTDLPVSRQHETEYLDYYNYPYYWGGIGLWGDAGYPGMLRTADYSDPAQRPASTTSHTGSSDTPARRADPHLRSCETTIGYHIQAKDGEIGHVKGMLVDDTNWAIRYLVVSTSNWWLGHDVLVATLWIQNISWEKETVTVDLTRDELRQAPHYDSSLPLAREAEIAIHHHYGRQGYWP